MMRPAWWMIDSKEGKCLESLLDNIIWKVFCSRFNSDEERIFFDQFTDFNWKPNKREMGWNKKAKSANRKAWLPRDTVQEKVQTVVELSRRAASGITQGLPRKCPGNTQYQSPCDSTQKSQNQNSPQSPAYPTAKAKSQHRNQSRGIYLQMFWGHGLVGWFGNARCSDIYSVCLNQCELRE